MKQGRLILDHEAERWPYAPFKRPIPIPPGSPSDDPCFTLCVSESWWPAVHGCLQLLRERDLWIGTPTEQQAALDAVEVWLLANCFSNITASAESGTPVNAYWQNELFNFHFTIPPGEQGP